jgi:hypothetical protein
MTPAACHLTTISEVNKCRLLLATVSSTSLVFLYLFLLKGVARRRCLDNGSWSFEQENECIPQRNATHVVRLGPVEDSVLRAVRYISTL